MASQDLIGPALPPRLAAAAAAAAAVLNSGPVAGPALPPGYKENSEKSDYAQKCATTRVSRETEWDSEEDEDSSPVPRKQRKRQEDDDDGFFGPALPPGFKKEDESPESPRN